MVLWVSYLYNGNTILEKTVFILRWALIFLDCRRSLERSLYWSRSLGNNGMHWAKLGGLNSNTLMSTIWGAFQKASRLLSPAPRISAVHRILSFNVWVRYFVWNFKGYLWNSTQNILPIHWKMYIHSINRWNFKGSCDLIDHVSEIVPWAHSYYGFDISLM